MRCGSGRFSRGGVRVKRTLAENWQPVIRAGKAVNVAQLRHCLEQCRIRVLDAEAMPWPSLAESWRRDAEVIQKMIDFRTGQCDGML